MIIYLVIKLKSARKLKKKTSLSWSLEKPFTHHWNKSKNTLDLESTIGESDKCCWRLNDSFYIKHDHQCSLNAAQFQRLWSYRVTIKTLGSSAILNNLTIALTHHVEGNCFRYGFKAATNSKTYQSRLVWYASG